VYSYTKIVINYGVDDSLSNNVRKKYDIPMET